MHRTLHRTLRGTRPLTRAGAMLAVLAMTAATVLVAAGPAAAAPTPPPNPTNGQISAAQAQKTALAATVGRLSGQVAAAEAELTRLQGLAEAAEQKVALAVSNQRAAEFTARRTAAASRAVHRQVAAAHVEFVREEQARYIGGQPQGGAAALLTAHSPTELLQENTLLDYVSASKVDAIGTVERLTVKQSNIDAAARRAVIRLKSLTGVAKAAQHAAAIAVSNQQAQQVSLQTSLTTNQASLTSAQSQLATLNGQRTTYLAYVAEQKRLARIRAARLARQRAAAAAAARAAAAAAAAARKNHRGRSTYASYSPPIHAAGGSWSAARGEEAVARARSTLGTPYAWAGGGSGGPSTGVCDASNGAPNDCYVNGYDCSGLAMYAWGPYISMAHYAATQYTQAGSYHPSLSDLKPGDLLFWSNGGISGIHHVAIFIGNGQIIQAPYSGGYVEVSSMYDPGSIFGATRPLT